MKHAYPWTAVTLLAAGLIACGGLSTPPPTPTRTGVQLNAPTPLPTSTLPPTLPSITGIDGTGGGGEAEPNVINNTFLPRSDGWRLQGEVAQSTGIAASNIALTVEWSDTAGNVIGSDTAYPLVTNIAPGESAPFIYNIYLAGVQLGSFTAVVSQFTSTQTLLRARLDVEHALLTA